jgi:ferric-dicitrate binding protein FerR (iron transport regulator)
VTKAGRTDFGRRAVLAGAAALALPRLAWAETSVGLVEALDGRAFARQSQVRALAAAGPILLNDRVWTASASRATLFLEPLTRLYLGPAAALSIDRYLDSIGGDLFLHDGGLVFDRPAGAGGDVSLRSGFGLIGVRGTRFFAGPSNGVFGVFVARGAVTVMAAGIRREVPEGSGVDIFAPGNPPSEVRAWGAPRIEAAFRSVLGP